MENSEIKNKCAWCLKYPLYEKYHDEEWGVPIRDSKRLFEKIILDGTQAGLSWWTILNRREHYRRAYDNFEPRIMAGYNQKKIETLIADPGIIRNKRKINMAINNAKAYVRLTDAGIVFKDYIWDIVDGLPIINSYPSLEDVPTRSHSSDRLSKKLKNDGFQFVGTTIIYAFMQAAGLFNDHVTTCYRHQELS